MSTNMHGKEDKSRAGKTWIFDFIEMKVFLGFLAFNF